MDELCFSVTYYTTVTMEANGLLYDPLSHELKAWYMEYHSLLTLHGVGTKALTANCPIIAAMNNTVTVPAQSIGSRNMVMLRPRSLGCTVSSHVQILLGTIPHST